MSSTTAYARNNKFNEQEFFNFLFFKSWKSWNDFLLHERFQPSQCWMMMRKKQLSINYLPSVEAMHDTKQLLIQLCMRQCLNTPERITYFVDFVFRGKVHSFSHIIILPANNMQCFPLWIYFISSILVHTGIEFRTLLHFVPTIIFERNFKPTDEIFSWRNTLMNVIFSCILNVKFYSL